MPMNVEAEIRELKRRVGELEGSFGFLTRQVQNVHKDLLAFEEKTEQRFNQIDDRFKKVDNRFDNVDGRLDHLDRGLRELRREMPAIVKDALSDYEIKSKKK
jgi:archaellum component FlaC